MTGAREPGRVVLYARRRTDGLLSQEVRHQIGRILETIPEHVLITLIKGRQEKTVRVFSRVGQTISPPLSSFVSLNEYTLFFIRMVFFRLSLSILNFFQKMSLEYSYHILSTHLAPGLNTSLNILTTGIFLTKEYTFTN